MLGKETLLERQCRWLLENNFDKIVVATNEEVSNGLGDSWLLDSPKIKIMVEPTKLDTAGAVKFCLPETSEKVIYIFNVDDLILETKPQELLRLAEKHGAAMRVGKPSLAFGRIKIRGELAIRFQEKPNLGFYVSVGHYAFRRSILERFPTVGSIEREIFPALARERRLAVDKLRTPWVVISTYKDYLEACKNF
jgi:NDP-sugar pyrophosphorylase family protein